MARMTGPDCAVICNLINTSAHDADPDQQDGNQVTERGAQDLGGFERGRRGSVYPLMRFIGCSPHNKSLILPMGGKDRIARS